MTKRRNSRDMIETITLHLPLKFIPYQSLLVVRKKFFQKDFKPREKNFKFVDLS